MGDRNDGAALHERLQGLLDEPLRDAVEIAGGLVENEEIGILEQGAGNRDALSLPPASPTWITSKPARRSKYTRGEGVKYEKCL